MKMNRISTTAIVKGTAEFLVLLVLIPVKANIPRIS